MQKIVLLLAAALFVAGWNNSVEAANKFQAIRMAVPRVVNTATKNLVKVGEEVSSFFWRNKVAITTGTVLVTAATHPEPFIDGAVSVAAGPPVIVQNVDSAEEPLPIPTEKKRTRSNDWNGYFFLGGLIGVMGLIIMYEAGGRTRTAAKIITVLLLFGVVLLCCGVARADAPGADVAAFAVWPDLGKLFWNHLFDILMIVILLFLPFGH